MSYNNWHSGVYYATIMSGAVVRWKHRVRDCEISASRDGVLFSGGFPILGSPGLRELWEIVTEAERVYGILKPDRGNGRESIKEQYPTVQSVSIRHGL